MVFDALLGIWDGHLWTRSTDIKLAVDFCFIFFIKMFDVRSIQVILHHDICITSPTRFRHVYFVLSGRNHRRRTPQFLRIRAALVSSHSSWTRKWSLQFLQSPYPNPPFWPLYLALLLVLMFVVPLQRNFCIIHMRFNVRSRSLQIRRTSIVHRTCWDTPAPSTHPPHPVHRLNSPGALLHSSSSTRIPCRNLREFQGFLVVRMLYFTNLQREVLRHQMALQLTGAYWVPRID